MSIHKKKIVRISTIPLSLKTFCIDLFRDLRDQYDILAVSSTGPELDYLAGEGIATHAVEMKRSISPLSDIVAIMHLVRLFRRERPDMVHSITPKAGLLAMIAARIAGVPVRVHSFTGLLFTTATGIRKQLFMLTDKLTCWCATHIQPEGQGVMNDLMAAGITNKPMRVLGNGNLKGIDLHRYSLTEELRAAGAEIRRSMGIGQSDFVFIFVGRIVRDKGITELTQAFVRICQQHPNVHLMLVGAEEEQGNELSDQTRQLIKSSPNIHSKNKWIEDVRPYYASADALVFPSYREGFPNVVLEAGAMELPSIVTDINGSREIITNGYNGLIVPTHSEDQLYEAMLSLVNDPELTDRMRSNSRPNVEQRFEAAYVRQCLKDYYRELLDI